MNDDLNLEAGLESAHDTVKRIARRSKLPDDLAGDYLRLTKIESGHNKSVRDSPKGAKGFGQVMPDAPGGTTRTIGGRKYNLRDPEENIEAGLRYFAEGGSDPVRRRLYYFGGPRAAKTYDRTGHIPNISDGNMTAAQYVRATGGQQRPKPEEIDLTAGLIDDEPPFTPQTGEVVDKAVGRGVGMARAQQPMQGLRGAQPSRRTGGVFNVAAQLGRRQPPSRADVMRAEEQPLPGTGTIGVDPRLLKGEQPSDPLAYSRAQELIGRIEPQREVGRIRAGATSIQARKPSLIERAVETVKDYAPGIRSLDTPMGIKTDPVRGALSLGITDLRRSITPEEKLIDPQAEAKAETAYQVGSFAPAIVPYVAAGKLATKIPSLTAATREAHIARTALTFGGVELGREAVRSIQTGEPLNPKEVAISTAIGASIGGIAGANPSLKRQIVAFVTPGVVADVARGHDPETATFTALTNLAFGLHGYKSAPREVRNAARMTLGEKGTQTVSEPLRRRLRVGEVREQLPEGAEWLNPETVAISGKPRIRLPTRGAETVAPNTPRVETQSIEDVPSRLLGRVQRRIDETQTQTQPPVETSPAVEKPADVVQAGDVQRTADIGAVEAPTAEPVRHVDLQKRRVRGTPAGQFKKETAAQREERRAQVQGVQEPPRPEPQVSPATAMVKRGSPKSPPLEGEIVGIPKSLERAAQSLADVLDETGHGGSDLLIKDYIRSKVGQPTKFAFSKAYDRYDPEKQLQYTLQTPGEKLTDPTHEARLQSALTEFQKEMGRFVGAPPLIEGEVSNQSPSLEMSAKQRIDTEAAQKRVLNAVDKLVASVTEDKAWFKQALLKFVQSRTNVNAKGNVGVFNSAQELLDWTIRGEGFTGSKNILQQIPANKRREFERDLRTFTDASNDYVSIYERVRTAAIMPPQVSEAAPPSKSATEPASGVKKEPWEMTREEYVADRRAALAQASGKTNASLLSASKGERFGQEAAINHRARVEKALSGGRPVPPEVLRDYPDLAPPAKTPVPTVAAPVETERVKRKGELSLPKTLEKAGLPGGEERFYDIKTNVESENRARQIIKERGVEGAASWVQSGEQPSAEQSAVAVELIKGLSREAESAPADIKTAKIAEAGEIASNIAVRAKEAGQFNQYFATLAKESPEGAVYYAEKAVKRRNPDAKLTTEQRNGTFDVASRLRAVETELETTKKTLADVERKLAVVRRPRRESQTTVRLREWADQAEKDARARLAARVGVKGSEAGASTIPADIADYAVIGAAKIARGTANFADWSAEMVREFGEDIKPYLRQIRSESDRLVSEQSVLAKKGKTVDEITRLAVEQGADARIIESANKFARGVSRTDFQRQAMRQYNLSREEADNLAVRAYKLYSDANKSVRQAAKERRVLAEEPDATPERRIELIKQRDDLMRQRGKERRELMAMLEQIEHGQPSVGRRLNNQFRGIVVSAMQTASRNLTTQGMRAGVESLTDAFELAMVRGKAKLGWKIKEGDINPRTRMLDTFKTSAYMFQRNKRVVNGILDEFPVEYEQMFRRFSSDIDITPKTKASKGIHKSLDYVDKGVEIANTPNRFQEFLGRRAVFRAVLETELKAEGVSLNQLVREGRQGEIDRAKVQKAVSVALRVTFAESPTYGTKGDMFVRFFGSAPAPINPLTFSRFLYNGAKFTLEYQPTTALRGLYRTARGKPGAVRDYAKAAVGTVMLTTAVQIYDAMHRDESEWYLLDIPKVGEVDIRPYQPFASYIFAAHFARSKQEGRPVSYEPSKTGNIGTYVEGLTGLSVRPVPAVEVIKSAAADKEWDGVVRQIKRMGGEAVAAVLTPLKTPKQIIAQFDEQEAVVRNASQEPFLGPIKRAVPFVGRNLPPLVRNEEIVTQPNPILQPLGVRTVMPDKRTQAERLAHKILVDQLPERERTDEEIARSQVTTDLRRRARRGEDVSKEVEALKLPERQSKAIMSAAGHKRLQEDVKRLPLYNPENRKDALTVYSTASFAERESLKDILEEKSLSISLLPAEDQIKVQHLLDAIGMKPGLRRLQLREPRSIRQPRTQYTFQP